jgi:hypothetical protein
MLIGILVVAFPVSVFSDLWSQELKRSKQAALREKARKRAKAMLLSTRNATRRSNGKSQSLIISEEDDNNNSSGKEGKGNNIRSNKTPPLRSQSAPSFPTSSSIRSASSLRSSPSSFRKGHSHPGSSSLRQGREEEKTMAITSIQEMEDDDDDADEDDNSVVEFRDISETVRDLNGETDGSLVVVDREDLDEIHQCLHAIRSNERRVQALLGKYKLGVHV